MDELAYEKSIYLHGPKNNFTIHKEGKEWIINYWKLKGNFGNGIGDLIVDYNSHFKEEGRKANYARVRKVMRSARLKWVH
jgi:hypothetical protein